VRPIDVYKKMRREIQSIYRSRLQVQILLSLGEKNRTLSEIREITNSTSQAVLPKIRKLQAQYLIETSNYEYRLTPLGDIVRMKIEDFVLSVGVINRHRDFWATHFLEGIPQPFLSGIGDLQDSELVSDTNVDIFQVYSHFLRMVKEATWIHGITSIMSVGHADALAHRIENNTEVELIVSPDVIDKLREEPYVSMLRSLAPHEKFKILVYHEPLKVGITVTDKALSLGLYKKDGITYDTTTDLFSSDPRAITWGEGLFSSYRSRAELVRF
jgi:predicted transcriptional regulator